MTLTPPVDPDAYTEQLPRHATITVDRDSNEGLAAAVDQYLRYVDVSPAEARRAVVAGVRDARAGDVVTVGPVRIHVR